MSDENVTTATKADENTAPVSADKGKGKAVDATHDVEMDDDEESSESEAEDQVCFQLQIYPLFAMLI